MIVNQQAILAIYKSFNTIFNEALESTKTYRERVAMEVPSTGASVDYKWLGVFPMLREWIGDRQVKNLTAFEYNIKNKDFEGTIEVDRNDIEDDQIGVYRPIIQGLAANAKLHPDYLIFQLLKAGISQLCYDGQYFFDTDHPVAGASVSNYGGGAGTLWFLLDTSKPIKPLVVQSRRPPAFISKDQLTDYIGIWISEDIVAG
ncbi:MAG: Mu-like prophage major head subunit gpT family protein [Nitrospirae bacterium]|nr:Mu-like prophage major head subunit gpT family protein [Nitrospirota bacterium]